MSQKRRYRGGRKSVSFKPIGGGLRASEERIKEQARTITGGLEFAMATQKAADKLKIEGLADKVAFEKVVQEKMNKLEKIADNRQLEATELRAKREVDHLKGIADEYGKKAKHLAQLAPKQAQAIQSLGKGVYDLSEAIEYIQLNEHRRKTEQNEDQQTGGVKLQVQQMQALLEDIEKRRAAASKQASDKGETLSAEVLAKYDSLDPEEIWRIFGPNGYYRTNTHQGKQMLTDLKDNRNYIFSQVEAIFQREKIKPTESTADEWYRWAAYKHLEKWGISPKSREGSLLVDTFLQQGRLKAKGIRDQNRSQKTEYMRNVIGKDVIHELTNPSEDGDKWLNLTLNSLTYVTRTGVHKDKKNGYTYGVENDNTALAGEEAVIFLVTTFPERFNETKIRELMDRFVIQDKFGKTGDKTPFGKRHPLKVDNIVSEWSTAAGQKASSLKGKKDSEDVNIIKDFQLKQENHNKWKQAGVDDQGNPYTKTDDEFRLEQLEHTINLTGGSEWSRNQIYSDLQITPKNHANVSHIINLERLFLDGNIRGATNYYLSKDLTNTKREQLRHRYELFNNITESGWQNTKGNGGVAGIQEEVRGWVIADEVTDGSNKQQLSGSGEETVNDLINEVLKKAKAASATMGWEKAIAAAIAEEQDLYNQGFNPINPNQLVPGAKYARVRGAFLDKDGIWRDRFHYPRKQFIKSEPIVLELAGLRKQGFNLNEVITADKELASKLADVEQFSDNTIQVQLARGSWKLNDYITNDQVFTPKVKSELLAHATAIKNGDLTFGYDIPERVNMIAERFNMSTVDVLNLVIEDAQPKDEKEKIRFTQDGHSIQWFNGQQWEDPKLPERYANLIGKGIFDSSRAQGVIPERPWIRAFTEEGLGQSEAFMQSIGVTSTYNEKNDLILSDSRSFFEKDGIQQLSTEDTFKLFPTLTNIDFYRRGKKITKWNSYELNELRVQLQKLRDNPPGYGGQGRTWGGQVIKTDEGVPVKKQWRQDIKNLEKQIEEFK